MLGGQQSDFQHEQFLVDLGKALYKLYFQLILLVEAGNKMVASLHSSLKNGEVCVCFFSFSYYFSHRTTFLVSWRQSRYRNNQIGFDSSVGRYGGRRWSDVICQRYRHLWQFDWQSLYVDWQRKVDVNCFVLQVQ